MSIEAIVRDVEAAGLLPVVRAESPQQAIVLALALHRGGIRSLEITMTVPDATAVIAQLSNQLGGDALVGAGTVLTPKDAERCIDAGARFIVSPGNVPGLIAATHARGAAVMPGCLTPTEVIAAWQEGADCVKVFPCSALGGAKYLRALKAPLPDVKLLPTGGVNLDTISDYIAAGACALGVGAALADVDLLQREGADAVSALATAYVDTYRSAKSAAAHP